MDSPSSHPNVTTFQHSFLQHGHAGKNFDFDTPKRVVNSSSFLLQRASSSPPRSADVSSLFVSPFSSEEKHAPNEEHGRTWEKADTRTGSSAIKLFSRFASPKSSNLSSGFGFLREQVNEERKYESNRVSGEIDPDSSSTRVSEETRGGEESVSEKLVGRGSSSLQRKRPFSLESMSLKSTGEEILDEPEVLRSRMHFGKLNTGRASDTQGLIQVHSQMDEDLIEDFQQESLAEISTLHESTPLIDSEQLRNPDIPLDSLVDLDEERKDSSTISFEMLEEMKQKVSSVTDELSHQSSLGKQYERDRIHFEKVLRESEEALSRLLETKEKATLLASSIALALADPTISTVLDATKQSCCDLHHRIQELEQTMQSVLSIHASIQQSGLTSDSNCLNDSPLHNLP